MPTAILPGGTIKKLPYDKPKDKMPMMGGGGVKPMMNKMGDPHAMLVEAIKGIKQAAQAQGLDFDSLLAEADQGGASAPPAPMPGM